jgi:hypothetical protein
MILKLWVKAITADRGEGPVPYIILVGAMAAAALVIAGLLSGVAQGVIGRIRTPTP